MSRQTLLFFFFFLVSLFVFVGLPVPGIGQVFLRIDISDANVNIAAYGKLALVTFCVHPPPPPLLADTRISIFMGIIL